MKRRLLNLLTALSLLLCVAAAVMWVRSYTWKEGFSYGSRAVAGSFYTRYGRLTCSFDRNDHGPLAPRRITVNCFRRGQSNRGMNLSDRTDYAFAGFGFKRHGWAHLPKPTWVFLVPMWFITALTALPPALWLQGAYCRRAAKARRLRGRCSSCGYDLRATPGRCPECGRGAGTSAGSRASDAG